MAVHFTWRRASLQSVQRLDAGGVGIGVLPVGSFHHQLPRIAEIIFK